nr:uncharacterized protein LOC119173496 [Rhipicephalus microplus]
MTSLPENHKSSLRTNLFLSGHGSSASSMMPDLRVFPMQAALALLVVWLPAVSSDSACSHLLWQVHSSGVKTTSSGIFFNATSSAKLDHHLPRASTMTSLPENHKSSLRTNLFLSWHGSSASNMILICVFFQCRCCPVNPHGCKVSKFPHLFQNDAT